MSDQESLMQTLPTTFELPARASISNPLWQVRLLPGLSDLALLLPLFLLFGILPGSKLLLMDADMGWHIRTGEWILQTHRVPTTDLFSSSFSGKPWFAWEWLWDVSFAGVHHAFGLSGVVLVNAAALSLVSLLTFRLARKVSGNDLISLLLTAVAMCGSTVHWLARPHLISWLFFLGLAHLLARASEGRLNMLWVAPPMFALWANVHGSFVMGLLMLLLPASGFFIDSVIYGSAARTAMARSQPFLVCFLLSALATLANPYGWRLHEHVWRYLSDGKQLDMMSEFQSMNFHHAPAPFFEIMLLLGTATVLWCIRKRDWTGAQTIVLWAHLGLFAVRNVPMYLFLTAPFVSAMLSEAVGSGAKVCVWLRSRFHRIAAEFQPLERIERFHLVSLAAFAFVTLSVLAGNGAFAAQFDPRFFPASALKTIDRYHPKRIFARDQWSAYLLYQRYPQIRVQIDDRSDFYGADMLERVGHILEARWDWEADLLKYSTDMVIVAPDAPLATVLKSSPRWSLVQDDQSVVVFVPNERNNGGTSSPGKDNSAVASNGGRKLGI